MIDQFTEYQIEWLTSHCDIELEPKLEQLIIRFLKDTAHCFKLENQENNAVQVVEKGKNNDRL